MKPVRCMMLTDRYGAHKTGSVHDIVEILPHGGYTDSAELYILRDGTTVQPEYVITDVQLWETPEMQELIRATVDQVVRFFGVRP